MFHQIFVLFCCSNASSRILLAATTFSLFSQSVSRFFGLGKLYIHIWTLFPLSLVFRTADHHLSFKLPTPIFAINLINKLGGTLLSPIDLLELKDISEKETGVRV